MVPSLVLAVLLAAQPAAEARVRLTPVDQCAGDASFVAFRDTLREAILRRDRDALLVLVSDDVAVDFGGGVGRAAFVETWELDRPATSRVWHELGEVLRLGCAREPGDEFLYSPSWSRPLQDYEDPFTSAIAIRPGAELRVAPNAAAATLASLDWDLVTVPDWDWEAGWQRVVLADGRTGFVRSEDLRSPIDYRAMFGRVNGQWRIVTFIAGD